MIEEIDKPNFELSEDEEDVLPGTHNKLLSAVSQIYKKQRIDKPKRSEPTQQISEFNLSHKTSENDKLVDVSDLVEALNKRITHHEIKQKVIRMRKRSKPLPKPMEKLHKDRLKRSLGYSSVRTQLNQWEAVVQRNRSAEQLRFPLPPSQKVTTKESNDFLKTFKEPTELEKAMAAVLQTSEIAQEEKEKEEELFPLSLEEIIERRKMVAHMRARESYRIAKGVRQNKIKSKKYHRILKREKIKNELKEFEILQKTNPEAALEKLEKLERARAEERITLRHKNTGKWARSRAIRAKYDTEARAQLAEQLAKSRELTKKIQPNSSSEDEGTDIENHEDILRVDTTNPWNAVSEKSESEIQSFISGYKKFQDNVKSIENPKENGCTEMETLSATNKTNFQDSQVVESVSGNNTQSDQLPDSFNRAVSKKAQNSLIRLKQDSTAIETRLAEISSSESNAEDDLTEHTEKEPLHIQSSDEMNKKTIDKQLDVDKLESTESKSNLIKKDEVKNRKQKLKSVKINTADVDSAEIIENYEVSSDILKEGKTSESNNNQKLLKSNENRSLKFGNNKTLENKSNKRKRKVNCNVSNQSGSWSVTKVQSEEKDNQIYNSKENKRWSIDRIFDNAEHKLKKSLDDHINQLKVDLDNEKLDEPVKNKKSKYKPDLSFKSNRKRPDTDTTLIEIGGEGISSGENDIKRLTEAYEKNKQEQQAAVQNTDIDPHKFLPVKPSKLNSGKLKYVEEQLEAEDEEDENEKNRQLNLEEAFADDDVVEEFRREKEKEIESTKPKDVDLTLPGWGHWAGHNLEKKDENRLKRKNRRLIFKIPEMPRKDDKKDYVIINEEPSAELKKKMVHDLPYPFTSVKDYEASIRAPVGNTWVPQSAFMKLIQPAVITKLGSIIEPISKDVLCKKNNAKKNSFQKKTFQKKKYSKKQ